MKFQSRFFLFSVSALMGLMSTAFPSTAFADLPPDWVISLKKDIVKKREAWQKEADYICDHRCEYTSDDHGCRKHIKKADKINQELNPLESQMDEWIYKSGKTEFRPYGSGKRKVLPKPNPAYKEDDSDVDSDDTSATPQLQPGQFYQDGVLYQIGNRRSSGAQGGQAGQGGQGGGAQGGKVIVGGGSQGGGSQGGEKIIIIKSEPARRDVVASGKSDAVIIVKPKGAQGGKVDPSCNDKDSSVGEHKDPAKCEEKKEQKLHITHIRDVVKGFKKVETINGTRVTSERAKDVMIIDDAYMTRSEFEKAFAKHRGVDIQTAQNLIKELKLIPDAVTEAPSNRSVNVVRAN